MKRCSVCHENFENRFVFCPVDGSSLADLQDEVACEYRLTLLSETALARRMVTEFESFIEQLRRIWPEFKAEPVTFARVQFSVVAHRLKQTAAQPYVTTASLTAIAIVLTAVLSAFIFDRQRGNTTAEDLADELVPTMTLNFPAAIDAGSKSGVGVDDKGRVGFNRGHGDGSGPTPARSQGGGGGGDGSKLPSSQGRVPVPSVIPAPIPTTYARLPQSLPAAGIDIDPVLWKDLPFPNYGDPRSKSTAASNGPGEGGGVGKGKGTGIGEGENNGFGPGRNGNIGGNDNRHGCCGSSGANGNDAVDIDRIYRAPEVEVRARVVSKPEPQYTEEARRNQITGTVILSVVFARNGQVTDIRALQSLCCGLTEKAIAAARQIRFVPATRGGQNVSMHMQLEYNFNLY